MWGTMAPLGCEWLVVIVTEGYRVSYSVQLYSTVIVHTML